jgi:hypothetical protein
LDAFGRRRFNRITNVVARIEQRAIFSRMSQEKGSCGPHQVIVNTDGVRLAKCPCGTFHVTLVQSGVTLQLNGDRLAELGRAIGVALPPPSTGIRIPITGSTPIN